MPQARPTSATAGESVDFDGSRFVGRPPGPERADLQLDLRRRLGRSVPPSASHAYAKPGAHTATLKVTDSDGLTDTDTIAITVTGSVDLKVTKIDAGAAAKGVRDGEKVTIKATITNSGSTPAAVSSTAFLLDGQPMTGRPAAPPHGLGERDHVRAGSATLSDEALGLVVAAQRVDGVG